MTEETNRWQELNVLQLAHLLSETKDTINSDNGIRIQPLESDRTFAIESRKEAENRRNARTWKHDPVHVGNKSLVHPFDCSPKYVQTIADLPGPVAKHFHFKPA